MNTRPPVAVVVCHVRALLDSVADALVEGRVEPLLAAEGDMETALRSLTSFDPANLSSETRRATREEIERCRESLARCRRLGASIEQLMTLTLDANGRAGAYTRSGATEVVVPPGTLEARG